MKQLALDILKATLVYLGITLLAFAIVVDYMILIDLWVALAISVALATSEVFIARRNKQ